MEQHPIRRLPPKSVILCIALAACAQVPDLGLATTDRNTAFATLIPLGPLIAQADALANGQSPASADGRIAGLNARAAALRGAIIDPATRARMQAGVDTSALQ